MEIKNEVKHKKTLCKKKISAHTYTHYKNYKLPATNSTSFIYALRRGRNCSQEIVAETCDPPVL